MKCFHRGSFHIIHKICQIYQPTGFDNSIHQFYCHGVNCIAHYAQVLLHSFINCIQFMLDTFPACDLILSNIFYWYETNFGNVAVPRHVLLPTNTALVLLPWHRLKPTPLNIFAFHRLLQQVITRNRREKYTKIFIFKYNLYLLVSSGLSFIFGPHFPSRELDTMAL